MRRICLIEDSVDLRNLVVHELKDWFEISPFGTLAEADQALGRQVFDLILLDVQLPDGNGFEFCARLKSKRELRHVPVIFLTARSESIDKMMGFNIGADDYVVKPFDPIELRARIEARLRSRGEATSGPAEEIIGDLRFDRIRQRAYAREDAGERDLNLTPFEFKLLSFLAVHAGQVFKRDDLLKQLQEPGVHVGEEIIYTHVSALRRKLGAHRDCIESIPRVGYRFRRNTARAA